MQINPETLTYTDPTSVDYFSTTDTNMKKLEELQAKMDEIASKAEDQIFAIGPEDHLKALKQDLIKQGYKKAK